VLFRATRIARDGKLECPFLQIADTAANINKKISSCLESATYSRISISLIPVYTRRYLRIIGRRVVFKRNKQAKLPEWETNCGGKQSNHEIINFARICEKTVMKLPALKAWQLHYLLALKSVYFFGQPGNFARGIILVNHTFNCGFIEHRNGDFERA